ncbi:hypothetical protein S7335_3670 [Synechococcus sp. PCC 7335]|uniref:DUF2726 domain-containing protein n=1 Tax=Synechococcus sp. (strain ATCC 29403 / PCC 7335) TaxID=91464 RepID=UPI00017ED56F|nr:DUF2726 domain-containing protein [Synechococcus sp. PCC 7335]EDX85967.1 hypothetical protein S7335_3670 [Synechococcus sp. PCC 7335]
MNWVILLAAVAIVAIAVLNVGTSKKAAQKKSKSQILEVPYRMKGTLFTPTEQEFYYALCQALPAENVVFGKVRVADVIAPAAGLSKSQWRSAFNRIQAKHFDFVLCDRSTLTVNAVIELQDTSHKKPSRARRDQFLRKVCTDAQLPLLEFSAKPKYVVKDIENSLTEICSSYS